MPPRIDERWVDIAPPEAPAAAADPLALAIAAALLAAVIVIALLVYRHPRQRARRALRRLARDLRHARGDSRPACLHIRQCLRDGLGLPRTHDLRPAREDTIEWQAYWDRLAHCCFAAEPPAAAEVQSILREALVWLNRKPVRR